jgi:DNA-binding CsgD family transcriptional regulator
MPHYHALLGAAQWLSGDWNRARTNFGLAVDLSGHYLAPTAAVLVPLGPVGRGDLAEADALVARADEMVSSDPWVEASDLLDIVKVARLHADAGAGRARRRALDSLHAKLDDVEEGRVHKSPLWLAHAALAAVWAKEPDRAARCTDLMALAAPAELTWTATMAHWLRGLVAEARGIGAEALDELRQAVSDVELELPLYRAHMCADHARVALVLGDAKAAERSLVEAGDIYRRLGASGYAAQVDSARQVGSGAAASRSPKVALTDREQDVLALIAAGMSYAQIARDLFVTQSTVGYHLSNIYRKVGVSSRHELTAMVRADPGAYGIVTG